MLNDSILGTQGSDRVERVGQAGKDEHEEGQGLVKEDFETREGVDVTQQQEQEVVNTTSIAFGFDSVEEESSADGAVVAGKPSASSPETIRKKKGLFFGDDPKESLQDLSNKCALVAVEVAVLLKSLKTTLKEACDITAGNMKAYQEFSNELEMVIDANISGGEQLVERTLALSLELQQMDGIKSKIVVLEKALSNLEKIANRIIR